MIYSDIYLLRFGFHPVALGGNLFYLHICDFHQTDRKASFQIYGTAVVYFYTKFNTIYRHSLVFFKIRINKCAFHTAAAFFVLQKLIWYAFFESGLNVTRQTLRVTENSQPR